MSRNSTIFVTFFTSIRFREIFSKKTLISCQKSVRFIECPLYHYPLYRDFFVRNSEGNHMFPISVSALWRCSHYGLPVLERFHYSRKGRLSLSPEVFAIWGCDMGRRGSRRKRTKYDLLWGKR